MMRPELRAALWTWVPLIVLFAWDRYEVHRMRELAQDICVSGIQVQALAVRAKFLEILTVANDELKKKTPELALAEISHLAEKAQTNPSDLEKAVDRFRDCVNGISPSR